ncbi:MAG: AraC family transcriptional regulator [SAR116 cluster bacterium MED-G04]|jgi:transcriptional regulator GlxA family with amidase domain|nr:AraC family transcriptional regulator [SAR116 cluster bacterium]OUW36979.1 MAG: AraC family transcriptional regulator [Gammaproteobacteria bacterium TMED183]PDH62026.1 MAG: AraC family transcriptional regulator [SAR116 cluster bacterium MED-G04]HCD50104.1 AraC family transcriptional regulator [Alphaproteobacteria bacterium]CAI8342909.1 MAG: HTH-type transcriptional regulator CdhR [SAR116 cluster bacterium MED-G04]|tara:strand:+ start:405 stop:1394 length:990 start_codon:yes stop_codon:yes gene_type:complete
MDDTRFKILLSSGSDNKTLRVGFLLVPNFSMLAFSSAIEPLRSANRMSEKQLFEWILSSSDGMPVMASNGVEVAANGDLEDLSTCDIVFACSGIDVHRHCTREMLNCLRLVERRGAAIGAICTGTWLLAKAGLLKDRRCTIHWENHDGLVEEFPDLEVTNDLFEIDGDRVTCSGGTASLDMMLHLIAQGNGNRLATLVSEQFIHDRIRDAHDRQRMELRARLGVSHPKLLAVVGEMEANLEDPLPQTEIASRNALSTRQLERLFRKYLNTTPTRYYLNLRIARARYLLRQTSMSILSVALACGFVSASHFSKCYRETYGRTPRAERALD